MTKNPLIPISECMYFKGSGGQSSFVDAFYQGRNKNNNNFTKRLKGFTKKK